jgi:hypothetical protein
MSAPKISPSTAPHTSDIFDSPLTQSSSIDAMYDEHHLKSEQGARRRSWHTWLWVLLVLIAINAALWLGFTAQRSVLGASSEQAPIGNLAEQKIVPQDSQKAPLPVILTPPVIAEVPAVSTGTSVVEKTVCMLWEFSSTSDVKRADNRLSEQAWSGYVSEIADEPSTYMVFVGPFDTHAELDLKIKVLEKMKLKDYSPLPSALISLGVLSTQDAANTLKQGLTKRGLLGVQVSERTGSARRTRYRFEGLTPDSLKELNTVAANLGALRPCV